MKMNTNTNTVISILLFGIWSSRISWVKCDVVELKEANFQKTIDDHLFVFVMFYHPIDWACMGTRTSQPGADNFGSAAKAAKENGLTKKFDLKFGKVNAKDENDIATKYGVGGYQSCSTHPPFILFKYGIPIRYESTQQRYGANADIGRYILSDQQLSIQGMFDFLEKNTNPSIKFIETKEELDKLVNGVESTVIGYFQDGSKARVPFWKLADKKKDYIWGTVTNPSLNKYRTDTIVATQEFGLKNMTLDRNFDENNIGNFVGFYATPYILKLTPNHFQDEIDKTLLILVLFYDPTCTIPDYFAKGALAAQENGIAGFLGLKFGQIDIRLDQSKLLLSKYSKLTASEQSGCKDQWKRIILFRYGKSVQYGGGFGGGFSYTQQTETIQGLFEWLEKSTKPAVKIIVTEYDLGRFAEYIEVTILGYFKDPKARVRFWSVADKLKDYKWAEVTNPYLNPFEEDTIVINQEYGVVRLRMNETLSAENIETFVKKHGNSSAFPVPTRTPRPDTDIEMDSYHADHKYVFIYDGSYFAGDFLRIDLKKKECIDTTKGNWTLGIRSARTYGQCLKIYDTLKCRRSTKPGHPFPLVLDDSNFPVHVDFGRAEFYSSVRSISSCNYDSTSTAPSTLANNNPVLILGILASMFHCLRLNPKVLDFDL